MPPSATRSRQHTMNRRAFRLAAVLLALLIPALAAPAHAKDKVKITRAERKEMRAAAEKLAEKYRQWLEDEDPDIADEELEAFLAEEKDYQGDAFIMRGWGVRAAYN